MEKREQVTVVTPAYNAEKYIEECIMSVLSQTYKNIEMIVIDDGSTDNTGKILDRFSSEDSRLKVIHQENTGSELARKAGLESSDLSGYVMFLDADDYFMNTSLVAQLVVASQKEKADIVCFGYTQNKKTYLKTETEQHIKKQTALGYMLTRNKLDGNLVCKLYNGSLFEDIIFVKKRNCDFLYVGQAIEKAERILLLPITGYFYRRVKDSQSRNTNCHPMEEEYERESYLYYVHIASRYPAIKEEAEANWLTAMIYVCRKLERDKNIKRAEERFLKYKRHYREQWKRVMFNRYVLRKDKVEYWLCYVDVFRTLYSLKNI